MVALITDPGLEARVIAERKAIGADRYDEVWEGVTMMAAMPNDEHQDIVANLTHAFVEVVQLPGLGKARPGINLSDRYDDWESNYRCPDVAVFLNETKAENLGSHWRGAADFLVEVISPRDRAREKLPFYEELGVREVLLVDRDPWRLELYRLASGKLAEVGRSDVGSGVVLSSKMVPLTFELVPGDARPQIQVVHVPDGRKWLA